MGTVFFITALAITIVKPYRKAYMNHLDALLLSYCAIFCYVLPFSYHTQLFVRILITISIAVFIIIIILKKMYGAFKSYKCKLNSQRCVHKYFYVTHQKEYVLQLNQLSALQLGLLPQHSH